VYRGGGNKAIGWVLMGTSYFTTQDGNFVGKWGFIDF
jgi:hypothetical protein